jgi:hypothetical protein
LECEEDKDLLPLPGVEPQFLSHPAKSVVAISYMLSWCSVCYIRSKFCILHCVCCGTNGVDSVVNVVSPMLMYSFTKNESLEYDLHTFLTKVNMVV